MIPKFVEDIDDKMSAYDAAIRIYAKVVNATDYDTIALNEQKAKGGPADESQTHRRRAGEHESEEQQFAKDMRVRLRI